MKITDPDPKVYIILGMHKSGTSFISKAIAGQDVDMGVVDQGTNGTLYEHPVFNKLNYEILHSAGGSWENPPHRDDILREMSDRKEEISQATETRGRMRWGWKDPRTSLTIDGFLEEIDTLQNDVYLVCIFRKPTRVERAILRTGPMENVRALINEYNRRIIASVKKFVELE